MKRLVFAAGIACLSMTMTACSGSAAGSCATSEDVAVKVTGLTDDLKRAQDIGKIDTIRAGEIGAQMLDAGTKFGSGKDHRSYCEALESIRKAAGL